MNNVEREQHPGSLQEMLERILGKGIVLEVWERLTHGPFEVDSEARLSFAQIQTLLLPQPALRRRAR